MSDTTYNGWKNYETWSVKLWMDNEEGSYNYWNDRAQTCLDEADGDDLEDRRSNAALVLAGELKSEHEEAQPELVGVWSDLLSAALSEVDWYEIAENMIGDIEPSDAE